jgi:hypothetical protein
MKKWILLFIALLAICSFSIAQNDIYWNSTTTAPTSIPGGANYTVGSFTQNNNNGTTTFNSTASASSGYTFTLNGATTSASGTNNFVLSPKSGTLDLSSTGSTYAEVIITPASGYEINIANVNFASRATGTGPTSYSIQSVIAGTSTQLASGSLSTLSSWEYKNNTATILGGVNQPVAIRIYGYNGTGSSGTANWRLDDIVISVTSIYLPVTFGNILASQSNGQLKIQWATVTEAHNDHFDIEISKDGNNFSKIASLKSKALNGFSTQSNHYEYMVSMNQLNTILGLPLAFGFLALGLQKRRRLIAGIAFVLLIAIIISCNKNETSTGLNTKSIFVRVAQVDVDGKKAYSKIIKAVTE